MGLTNFILTCEKDNESLRKDIQYYKKYNNRLKQENKELKEHSQQKDKAIDECIELVKYCIGHINGLLEKLQQAKGDNK